MVRNKTELLQCANAWVSQAKNDIRNQIVNFIQMSGTSEEQLADALAISVDELISIIETNNEISLTTFAKLLIATDNVLEIKPLNESPLANAPRGTQPRTAQRLVAPRQNTQPRDANGRFTSTRQRPSAPRQTPRIPQGGFPMPPMGGIPVDRNGRPLPPPPGFPMPPIGGEQPQRFGGMPGMQNRFRPTPPPAPTVEAERPLDTLASRSRAELTQIIRDNFWDGEIDVEEATKTDLINFLASKRSSRTQRPTNVQRAVQQPIEGVGADAREIPEPNVEDIPEAEEDGSLTASRQMLDDALAANPHLRDVIGQYAPSQQ